MDMLQKNNKRFVKTCKQCGLKMYRRKSSEAKRANWLFCSRGCSTIANNKSRVVYSSANCEYCMLTLTIIVSNKKKATKRFCSPTCFLSLQNKMNNPSKNSERRKKISLSATLRGTSHLQTTDIINKRRKTISGSGHWNWKGGKTPGNRRRRNSLEMRNWRKMVFERDNYTCVLCFVKGSYLEADHIKPWAYFPELRFELSNGRTLCKKCHSETDTYMGRATTKFRHLK